MLYLESLRIIRQARAPFIIALNKIDKPGADPDFVKSQLKDEGVRYKCSIYFVQLVLVGSVIWYQSNPSMRETSNSISGITLGFWDRLCNKILWESLKLGLRILFVAVKIKISFIYIKEFEHFTGWRRRAEMCSVFLSRH